MTNEPVANILIVDDDTKTLVAMEALLAGPGRKIVRAESGSEALRCLLREDFVLVLLDVRLPDMGGFETEALIRQRSRRLPLQTSRPASIAGQGLRLHRSVPHERAVEAASCPAN